MKTIIFDTETNGLSDCSVLSFSAILIENDKIIKTFDRYYFPREEYNEGAISVNGLNEAEILKRRAGQNYPKFFNEDEEIKKLFEDVDTVVGHNVEFDIKFLNFELQDKNIYCTMFNATDIIKIPNKHIDNPDHPSFGQEHKWPRLSEAVEFFNIDTQKIEGDFHSSLFDCFCTLEIYKRLKNV